MTQHRKLPKVLPHFTLRIGGSRFIPGERTRARDGAKRVVDSLHLARTWRTRVSAEKFAATYDSIGTIELGNIVNGEFVFVARLDGGDGEVSQVPPDYTMIGEYEMEKHE